MRHKNPLPWILIAAGVLLVFAGIAFLRGNNDAEVPPTPTPATAAQVQRVPLEDAKAALDSKSAVFLDVRDSSSYDASHIPGAVNIPISELANRMGELDHKAWIITYCT